MVEKKFQSQKIKIPKFLFHGTCNEDADKIRVEGFKAQIGVRTTDWTDRHKFKYKNCVWLTDRLGAAAWYALNHPKSIADRFKSGVIFVIRTKNLEISLAQDGGFYPHPDPEDQWNWEDRNHTEFVICHDIPVSEIINEIPISSIEEILDFIDEYEEESE